VLAPVATAAAPSPPSPHASAAGAGEEEAVDPFAVVLPEPPSLAAGIAGEAATPQATVAPPPAHTVGGEAESDSVAEIAAAGKRDETDEETPDGAPRQQATVPDKQISGDAETAPPPEGTPYVVAFDHALGRSPFVDIPGKGAGQHRTSSLLC